LALKRCLNKYSLFDNISANIPSEYEKYSKPDRGLQFDLTGVLICENVGVNAVLLVPKLVEFQYEEEFFKNDLTDKLLFKLLVTSDE
jgi:hypothetical protein